MSNNIKTLKDWRGDLSDYLKPNDEIDEDLYYYFLEVLPPEYQENGVFQVGEPYSHDKENKPIFDTFEQIKDKYFYRGHLTTKQAKELTK